MFGVSTAYSDELKVLDTEFNYVKDRLGAIVGQANETQELVSAIHNDSLTIYRDIYAINLPDVNATVLKQNISNLNAEVLLLVSVLSLRHTPFARHVNFRNYRRLPIFYQ